MNSPAIHLRKPTLIPKGVFGLVVVCLPLLSGCGSPDHVSLVGTVERRNLELTAPISEIIKEIPVKIGDRVDSGQLLVQLDPEVAELELKAREAALAAAGATLAEAKREFKRMEGLRRANISAVREFDRARAGRDEAVAAEAEMLARVTQARKRLQDLSIRSLASGVVDQLPFDVGERAPAGGVVGIVLADDRPWVRVWLPAESTARARAGLEARVRIDGVEGELTGRIGDIAREPEFTPHYALTERERAHLVFETRIILEDAPQDLRPGVAADVEIQLPPNPQ